MPRLIVRDEFEERMIELDQDVLTAGRSKKNQIPIRDEHSSREHCELRRTQDGSYMLVDLNSRNGTLVNGCPVHQHRLRHGDKIEIGDTLMIYTTGESRLEYIQRDTPAHLEAIAKAKAPPAKNQFCTLTVLEGERKGDRYTLEKLPFTIGRNKGNSVVFRDDRVSGRHAEVAVDEQGRYVVRDVGSTNGTFVNGQKISKGVLKSGQVIEVGGNHLQFQDPQSPAAEEQRRTPPSLPAVDGGDGGGHPKSPPPGGSERGLNRERLSMIMAGVVSLGVIGAIYFFLPAVLRVFLAPPEAAAVDPTNLLGPDPSFERPDPQRRDLFAGWRIQGTLGEQFAADPEEFAHGKCSLRLDSLDTVARLSEMAAVHEKEIPVAAGDALHLTGHLRVRNARGIVGYRITWLDAAGKAMGEAWSGTVTGDVSWQREEAVFIPPARAASARLSCVGRGAFGQAWFDGLHLQRRPFDAEKDVLALPHDPLRLDFDRRGGFSLFRNAELRWWDARIRIWTAGGKSLDQMLAAVAPMFPAHSGGDFQTQVRLVDPDTGKVSTLSVTTLILQGKLSLNWRLELDAETHVDQVELVMTGPPERLAEGFLLATEAGELTEPGAFPRCGGIVRLACGPAKDRLIFSFPAPAACLVKSVDGYAELHLSLVDEPDKTATALEFGLDLD